MSIWDKYFGKEDESREDFFSRHGVVEEEYLGHMDFVRDMLSKIGIQYQKEYDHCELIDARFLPYGIYNSSKKARIDDLYSLNSFGLRSDEFTNEHNGKHILFAGCSNTVGDSFYNDLIWPKKLYDMLSKEEKTSGYYNVGVCGASISEIISQVNNYIDKFGSPDLIFINLPNLERESEQKVDLRESMKFIYTQYSLLEKYCRTNGTLLISFSWNGFINSNKDFLLNDIKNPLKGFDTIHTYSIEKERFKHMHDYAESNPAGLPEDILLVALDYVHPGAAEYDFYADFAYRTYKGLTA